jgi:sec-independent protein translocase protein TatA
MLATGTKPLLTLAIGGLGTTELLVILALVVVIFGASKIPQLGRGLGEGIRNFKRGLKGDEDDAAGERRLPPEANDPNTRR